MKRIFCLLLSVIISAGVTGCAETYANAGAAPQSPVSETTVAETDDSEGVVPVESIEIVVGDDEEGASVVENTTTEIPIETTMTEVETTIAAQTQEISEKDIPFGNSSDIGMTDEEIYELGMKRADELHELFMDFLSFRIRDNLVFNRGNSAKAVYVFEDVGEIELTFSKVIHDTIKTYDDLYTVFNEVCTPEFSTYLLNQVSHLYIDIDGSLYFNKNEFLAWPYSHEGGAKLDSFEIVDSNKIKLNFIAKYSGPVSDEIQEKEYAVYLTNIEGAWLVSDCLNICFHGYSWNSIE